MGVAVSAGWDHAVWLVCSYAVAVHVLHIVGWLMLCCALLAACAGPRSNINCSVMAGWGSFELAARLASICGGHKSHPAGLSMGCLLY